MTTPSNPTDAELLAQNPGNDPRKDGDRIGASNPATDTNVGTNQPQDNDLREKIYPFVAELNNPWKHVDEIMEIFYQSRSTLLDEILEELHDHGTELPAVYAKLEDFGVEMYKKGSEECEASIRKFLESKRREREK